MEYLYKADDERIQRKFIEFFRKRSIEEQCTEESLRRFRETFLSSENTALNKTELKRALEQILQIHMSESDFFTLFRRINLKRDGLVSWDEFISHLLLEFQEQDSAMEYEMLELLIKGGPQIMKTRHRASVCRIAFCPEILPDRTWSFLRGSYVTASTDGVVNYWTLDLKYERSAVSQNPFLKIRPTYISDMVVMADVEILCVSSIEHDLRFYDTVAKKFELRLIITGLKSAVVRMAYYFSTNLDEDSHILLGDMSGSIIIMSFSPKKKGPFAQELHRDLWHIRYEEVVRGVLKLKVTEFKNVHGDWVSYIDYCGSLRSFISSSKCSNCSLLISDPQGFRSQYKFSINKGVMCFNVSEDGQLLVTGGSDCAVRVWHPFVPKKPICIFIGHHEPISAIVIQKSGKRIYSISKDTTIKIWDVKAVTCLQTYNGLPRSLQHPISVVYNKLTHKLILVSMVMAIIVCEKVVNKENTDGSTHTKPVTCVLYNELYTVIVTTGLDSCIIVWNPWIGKRSYLVTKAHSQLLYGESIGVEITSACFDPSEQLLLTGARDGTLKMWNFNTGICIRNMTVEDQCEITAIVWLQNRILCTGWNNHVTEIADTEATSSDHKKNWESRHTDDIMCAAVRHPQALATASYNGELVLWRLETGQPYRIYQVSNPTGRSNVVYKKKEKKWNLKSKPTKDNLALDKNKEKNLSIILSSIMSKQKTDIHSTALSMVRVISVRKLLFLSSRPMAPNVGTLLVSLESGDIQVWSHHPSTGFLIAFSAIHKEGDYVGALATDPDNDFLFTGHLVGYIKVWLMKNYMLADPPHISMPELRLEFPFLWKSRFDGRAKRAVRSQKLPLLLSSVKGHLASVNSLQFVPGARMIISGSSDYSVRLWSLGGRYISTLGTFLPWSRILPDVPISKYFNDFRIPADIKREMSFTTNKVLMGGNVRPMPKNKISQADLPREVTPNEEPLLYGRRLEEPYLGANYVQPEGTRVHEQPLPMDNTLNYTPVYSHLKTQNLMNIDVPQMPMSVQKLLTARMRRTTLKHSSTANPK